MRLEFSCPLRDCAFYDAQTSNTMTNCNLIMTRNMTEKIHIINICSAFTFFRHKHILPYI